MPILLSAGGANTLTGGVNVSCVYDADHVVVHCGRNFQQHAFIDLTFSALTNLKQVFSKFEKILTNFCLKRFVECS